MDKICGAEALGDHKKWICNLEPHEHEHHRWVWASSQKKSDLVSIDDVAEWIDRNQYTLTANDFRQAFGKEDNDGRER